MTLDGPMTLPVPQNAAKELNAEALLRTLELLHPLIIVGDANSEAAWMSERCSALCSDGENYLGRPIADFLVALGDSSHQESVRRSISCLDLQSMHDGLRIDSRIDLGTRQGKSYKLNLLLVGTTTSRGLVASVWILRFDGEEAALPRPEEPTTEFEAELAKLFHDLRSPLASSLGFARLLRKEYGDALGEEGRHFAERTEQGVRAINKTLDDFLELSPVLAPSRSRRSGDQR